MKKTQNEVPTLHSRLKAACDAPREPLRSLAFTMTSHQTLLRAPGPLGFWTVDQADREAIIHRNNVQRQTAIIASGMMLGLVIRKDDGTLEVVGD